VREPLARERDVAEVEPLLVDERVLEPEEPLAAGLRLAQSGLGGVELALIEPDAAEVEVAFGLRDALIELSVAALLDRLVQEFSRAREVPRAALGDQGAVAEHVRVAGRVGRQREPFLMCRVVLRAGE